MGVKLDGGERDLFTKFARNYDKLSAKLSAGLDNIWRGSAVDLAGGHEKARVLDIATGTGAVAIMLAKKYKNYSVIGIDLNREMLDIARKKSRTLRNVKYIEGNVEELKFKKNSFDIVISAFALGNFEDLPKVIDEAKKVLKPGGRLILLDINKKHNKLLSSILNFYQQFTLTPAFNSEMRREINLYIHSKAAQVDKKMLMGILEDKGLKEIEAKDLSFKAVFIVRCKK